MIKVARIAEHVYFPSKMDTTPTHIWISGRLNPGGPISIEVYYEPTTSIYTIVSKDCPLLWLNIEKKEGIPKVFGEINEHDGHTCKHVIDKECICPYKALGYNPKEGDFKIPTGFADEMREMGMEVLEPGQYVVRGTNIYRADRIDVPYFHMEFALVKPRFWSGKMLPVTIGPAPIYHKTALLEARPENRVLSSAEFIATMSRRIFNSTTGNTLANALTSGRIQVSPVEDTCGSMACIDREHTACVNPNFTGGDTMLHILMKMRNRDTSWLPLLDSVYIAKCNATNILFAMYPYFEKAPRTE